MSADRPTLDEFTDTTPLDQYVSRGYASTARGSERETKALDAAVALTASRWGPPFATSPDDAGEWWFSAYECAALAVEDAIVDALLADAGGERA